MLWFENASKSDVFRPDFGRILRLKPQDVVVSALFFNDLEYILTIIRRENVKLPVFKHLQALADMQLSARIFGRGRKRLVTAQKRTSHALPCLRSFSQASHGKARRRR
jgi:hypothetical protein